MPAAIRRNTLASIDDAPELILACHPAAQIWQPFLFTSKHPGRFIPPPASRRKR